jgi:hypothetical protein
MKNRRFILLCFAAFLIYASVRTIMAGFGAAKVLPMAPPKTLGMGDELLATVNRLEKEITERIAYDVDVKNDPLKLSRIINTRGKTGIAKAEITESMNQLRLSCTIISPAKATAIIKHQGKSFVLGVGDEIAGRQVISIDKKKVVLRYNGQEIELFNRPAPLAEIKYETKEKLDQLEL